MHNIWHMFYGGCAIIFLVATVYFSLIGLGIGSSYALNYGNYDMNNGTSLTYGDKSTLSCYNDASMRLFGGCILYGSLILFIVVSYGLLIFIIWHSIRIYIINKCAKKDDTETKLLKTDIITFKYHKTTSLVLLLLLIFFVYPLTIGLGLGISAITFYGDYNMTTGWPNDGTVSRDRLVCYNDGSRSLLLGCIPFGLGGWVMVCSALTILIGITFPFVWFCICARDDYLINKDHSKINDDIEIGIQLL
jgi:hypothetical protein